MLSVCIKCGWTTQGNPYWEAHITEGSNCPACFAPGTMRGHDPCPTTQKAKGVIELGKENLAPSAPLTVIALIPVNGDYKLHPYHKKMIEAGTVFARPCPPSPEHGFVESRVIKSVEELDELIKETKKANKDSEVMLTPAIKAKLNAVLVPTLLTLGPGHDGATAGKKTVSVPLAGKLTFDGSTNGFKAFLSKAGIQEDKDPYFEAVKAQGDRWTVTQARAGAKVPVGLTADFIPATFEVKKVIKTNGEDLLEWAKLTKKWKGTEGLVIYHPGGSVTDHYSVHCRDQAIPIITTFEPEVGATLKKNSEELPPFDPEEVIKGMATASELHLASTSDGYSGMSQSWTVLLLLALHNSTVMRGPHSFWLGAAVAAICKLGLAALEGEGRHAHSVYAHMKGKPDIYSYYCSKTLSFARARLSRITQLLHYGFGEVKGQKFGYGGPKWALCGAALCPVFNAIKKLVEDPTESNASDLCTALNIAVNQAHNGGWWLNKFCSPDAYSTIPKGQIGWILQAGEAIWAADHHRKSAKFAEEVERFKKQVKNWPITTTIAPLRWRKASVSVEGSSFIVSLKASTVPRPITAKIPIDASMVSKLLKGANVVIKPGKVELVADDGTKPIWEEDPLSMEARPESINKPWG